MGFSRQEYWSELLFPPPGNLPDSGIEPTSLMSPALEGEFFTTSTTWGEPRWLINNRNLFFTALQSGSLTSVCWQV